MTVIYKILTGEILKSIQTQLGYEDRQCQEEEEGWRPDDVRDDTHFVDISDPEHPVLPRVEVPYSIDKTTITADGVDYLTVSGLPITPVFISVLWPDGSRDELTGSTLEFGHDVPGTYDIILSSPIHLDTIITVTAT